MALATAELFLLVNGHTLLATDDEVEHLTMGVAAGAIGKDRVTGFFAEHVAPAQ